MHGGMCSLMTELLLIRLSAFVTNLYKKYINVLLAIVEEIFKCI